MSLFSFEIKVELNYIPLPWQELKNSLESDVSKPSKML